MIGKLNLLIISSSLPFLFSLNGDFVFDDSEAIIKNKDISNFTENIFRNDFWGTNIKNNVSHKSYRPLTIWSFRLNYIIGKYSFNAYHFKITNLMCHIICCILVWQFYAVIVKCSYCAQSTDIAFLSALLFAVHPVHTEAISGIVGRADILAGISFFTCFLLYHTAVQYDKKKNNIRSWLCLFLAMIIASMAMLFKENGITVLGLCIIYELIMNPGFEYVFYGLISPENKPGKRRSVELKYSITKSLIRIGIVLLSIILLLYARWMIMGHSKPNFKPIDNPVAFSDSYLTKIATYNYIYFLNILLLMWPQWLCFDWSMGCVPPIKDVFDTRIIFILLMYTYGATALYLIVMNTQAKNKRLLVMAFAILIVPFLPASNIFFTVGFVLAERILYIPSAGYCILITIGYHNIQNRSKYLKAMKCIYLLLLLIYALKSWQRSLDWENEYNLFTSGLKVCPLNAKVHYNVAKVADVKNNTNWALSEYREAIRLYPQYYQAMNNLANLLKNQKKYAEAEYYFRKAIEIKKDFPAAWMNLGIVLASTGRNDEAEIAYKTAIEYRQNYPDCYYNLGNMYLDKNQKEIAMDMWRRAINLNPQHVLAWTNLLALLDNTERNKDALEIIPNALTVLPTAPSIHFVAGNIYGKIGKYKQAEGHFLKAIELFGDRVQAIHYANFGVLYHRWKKYDAALQMYKKALIKDPSFKSALKNIETLKKISFS